MGATTIALVANGAANAADLEPEVKLPAAVWDWSGGYIGGHVGGAFGRTSFSNPYDPAWVQTVRNGFINGLQVYPFSGGALYQVYTAPGRRRHFVSLLYTMPYACSGSLVLQPYDALTVLMPPGRA
ncbi:hypothetical protein XH98_36060 [Bradyrhizobium sp. CCBAU 51745]|nr:hypothetical protein [Bradyrhizobium sp. CCBAU 51745]MDA9409727.1 hypothetical protein [Bradyrhizobium sp. CCBAU 45384]MDA9444410.1 hypothetical protein [Bradyrhizobium sp. CCBAU 51745]